jgi:hypothetical protein
LREDAVLVKRDEGPECLGRQTLGAATIAPVG